MTKSELRKIYLAKRRSLTARDVVEKSYEIAKRFFAESDLSKLKTIHCYIPIAKFNEIATQPIFEKIWTDFPDVRTLVPRANRSTGELEHFYYTRKTDLIENSWGIREPTGGEKADPKEIDLVIVPLVCFDQRGHRVGYGKGYYDRFLRNCRPDCVTVGLSFYEPIPEIDDVHVGDVALSMFCTPEGMFRPQIT